MYEQIRKKLILLRQKAQKEMENCQQLKNRKRVWIAYERPESNQIYNSSNVVKQTSVQQQDNKQQLITEFNDKILSKINGITKNIDGNKYAYLQDEIFQIKLQNSNLKQKINQLLEELSKQEQKQNIILEQYENYKTETGGKLKFFENKEIKMEVNKKQYEKTICQLKEALKEMQRLLNQEKITNRHLKEKIQDYQKRYWPNQEQNIKLKEIVDDKIKLIQNLNIQIEEMEEKYEGQKNQINKMREQFQKLNRRVEECMNEKRNLEYEKKNIRKEFQNKLNEKQILINCVNMQKQREKQQQENQIQHLKKQLNDKISKLKQNDQQKLKYLQLLNLVKDKDTTIEALNHSTASMKNQISHYAGVLRKQQYQMRDLKVEIESAKYQIKSLEQSLQKQLNLKYEQQNIRLKGVIDNQESDMKNIKNDLESAKLKNEAIRNQIDKVKDENQKLKKNMDECSFKRNNLQKDKIESRKYFEARINEKDILINCFQSQKGKEKDKYKDQIQLKEDKIKQLNNQIEAKINQIKLQDQQKQKQVGLLNLLKEKDTFIDSLNQNIDALNKTICKQNQANTILKEEIENLKGSLMQKQNQIHQLNSFIETKRLKMRQFQQNIKRQSVFMNSLNQKDTAIRVFQQSNILLKQEIDSLKNSSREKDQQIEQLKAQINNKLITLNEKDEQRQRLYELYNLLSIKQTLDYQISSPMRQRVYSPQKRNVPSIAPFEDKANENSYLQNSIPITSNLCVSLNYTYQILKNSYLKMQAKHLILFFDLSSKIQQNQVLNKLIQGNEVQIINLSNKIKMYQDQVDHMTFRINQLQGIIAEQQKVQGVAMQSDNIFKLQKIIKNINHNNLKKQCSQENVMKIQSQQNKQKQINYIQLSPTDSQRFNRNEETGQINLDLPQTQSIKLGESSPLIDPLVKIKESNSSSNPSDSNHNLNGGKNKQKQNNYIDQEDDQVKQPETKKFGTKCSLELINENIEVQHFQSKQKSQDLIVPKQNNNQEVPQESNNKSSLSLQNNPDTEIIFTYQQLKEKYRLLIIEYQKMSEYLCRIHSINYNWKKNSNDIQHLSKVNVLSKLSQRLTFLIAHKQKNGLHQSPQFIGELNKLILDLQSYIHFLDHLIKIQPFQDYKYPYSFKRINKKLNDNVKFQKELILKKTHSEGGSYNDQFIQNFDIYPFEAQDIPHNQQKQVVQTEKQKEREIEKQITQFEKYCEQNKQLFSEISSVKNQSQQSQFINSKSELGHLLNTNKTSEQMQINSRFTLNINRNEFYDSDKLSHLPFKEVVYLYYQIKQKNNIMVNLINEKINIEKQLKKQIEQKQHDHKRKINQITKEFNESFGLLCLRSGEQLNIKKKDKPNALINNIEVIEKGSQKLIPRKLSYSKTQLRETEANYKLQVPVNQQLYSDQLNQKQQTIRVLTSQMSKNIERMKELQKLNASLNEKKQHLQSIISLKQKQTEVERIIVQQNLTQFINRLISKIHFDQKIIPSLILHKNKIFRKNSSSLYQNQVLLATKITQLPLKVQQVLDTIAFYLKIQQLHSQKKDFNKKQLEQILSKSISRLKRSYYEEILPLIKKKLQFFTKLDAQQWSMEFEGIRLNLKEEFNNNEIVDQIYNQLNLLINKLRTQNEDAIEDISVYSRQDDKHEIAKNENENAPKYMELKSENDNYKILVERLKIQSQEIEQQNSSLSQALLLKQQLINQQKQEINNCTETITQLRDYSTWMELVKAKQREIQFMQEETLALREQISKMKHKINKKSKVFYIEH